LREVRRGQDECATQERNGHDRDHQCAGCADGAAQDLRPQVLQPRSVVVSLCPIRDGGGVDPLVQVQRGRRRRQAAQQCQEARGPADLGGAGRAFLHVGRETSGVLREEVVHEERVDQAARSGVIKGPADGRRLAHIL
jgi:hypothetical protein